MADVRVEHRERPERKGPSIWPWIIGLLVLALLIWAIAEMVGGDETRVAGVEEVEPGQQVPPAAVPTPEAGAATIPAILSNPSAHVGQPFNGEVRVVDTVSDRGIWIEQQGQRLFAITTALSSAEAKRINPGQMLRITDGTLRDPSYLPQIPGAALDARTRRVAEEQQVFLVVDEQNIEIAQAGQGQQGTGATQMTPQQGTQR